MKLKLTTEQGVELTAEISDEEYKKIEVKEGRWKPKLGRDYYFIDGYGDVDWSEWADSRSDNFRYNTFNCFETEADAELWLEMISAERYVPKEGIFYRWSFSDKRAYPQDTHPELPELYYIGNCFRTEKEAEAWGKKYGDLIKKYIR